MIDQYKSRITALGKKHIVIKRRAFQYAVLRLLNFVLILGILYYYYRQNYSIAILLIAIAAVLLFFFIVKRHADIKYQQTILENKIRINENEIALLQQKPSFLPDGRSYHKEYSFTEDLDIFGPLSLYHIINRCFSYPGQNVLASWFTNPDYDKNQIINRQSAVEYVSSKIDLRQDLLAHGLAQNKGSDRIFFPDKNLIDPSIYGKIKMVRWIPPFNITLSITVALVTQNSNILLYGFLFNLILTGLFLKSTMRVMQKAEQTLKNLKNYHEPLKVLLAPVYNNQLLSEKKNGLIKIHQNLSSLQKRYNLLENRSNMIIGLLLNGLIGYDFIALSLLQKWYDAHAHSIPEWLDQIGWFEALFSLSTFRYNHPTYAFPIFDQITGIQGKNIRHPFIPDEDNVGNPIDFTLPLKVILLTGSNMSGKSTFLRSMGINQILAMAGSVVAADEFHTGLYKIYTSFRKSDSIQEHTSLFYDELKKLRCIFTSLENTERPALVLLDEILRGTNSDDKYHGSREVLVRLKDHHAMTMLATHDIALAQLEAEYGPIIQNYSFESQIQEGELYFDYKLRKGVAVNKNATFLMEKMGIIE